MGNEWQEVRQGQLRRTSEWPLRFDHDFETQNSTLQARHGHRPPRLTGTLGDSTRMRLLQLIKRHPIALASIVLAYALSYGVARYSQMLIHRVSFAGDARYHWIDTGDRFMWSPLGVLGPVSYFVFTPLRWGESFVWRFIPREYGLRVEPPNETGIALTD